MRSISGTILRLTAAALLRQLHRLGGSAGRNAGQTAFCQHEAPEQGRGRAARLLCQGLHVGRRCAAHRRADLAGDAPFAQPPLGQSGDDRAARTVFRRCRKARLGFRSSRRRYLAAARRPDDQRPFLASDWPRCGCLVHAEAGPATHCPAARKLPLHLHARQEQVPDRRFQSLDQHPRQADHAGGELSSGGARLRQPGDQKKLCETWTGDRNLLGKVRPIYGHDEHFHIRIACPPGSTTCEKQAAVPKGDDCNSKGFAWWFTKEPWAPPPKPDPNKKPVKPRQVMLSDLPKACAAVIAAPSRSEDEATFGGSAMAYTAQPAASTPARNIDAIINDPPPASDDVPVPTPRPLQ